jgi:hypothetical protein
VAVTIDAVVDAREERGIIGVDLESIEGGHTRCCVVQAGAG